MYTPQSWGLGSLGDREPHPWHCCQPEGSLVLFCSYPTPKTVSMRAGSMSQGTASSLAQTPVKCASVRWVRAMLRGGAPWGQPGHCGQQALGGSETGECPSGQEVRQGLGRRASRAQKSGVSRGTGAECGEAVGRPSWQECRVGVNRMGEETPGKWLGH